MSPIMKLFFVWCTVSTFVATSVALQCFKCGLYNDGVGSITPCINETYMKLIDCPNRDAKFCIKYMSEGTIVRDCVAKCTEKDNWNWHSRTLCCQEDACNTANQFQPAPIFVSITLCFAVLLRQLIVNRDH